MSMRTFFFVVVFLFGCQLLLHGQHPIHGPGHNCQAKLGHRIRSQGRAIIKPIGQAGPEHVPDNLIALQHCVDGLLFINASLITVSTGILPEGRFQVLRNANVVHHQP